MVCSLENLILIWSRNIFNLVCLPHKKKKKKISWVHFSLMFCGDLVSVFEFTEFILTWMWVRSSCPNIPINLDLKFKIETRFGIEFGSQFVNFLIIFLMTFVIIS